MRERIFLRKRNLGDCLILGNREAACFGTCASERESFPENWMRKFSRKNRRLFLRRKGTFSMLLLLNDENIHEFKETFNFPDIHCGKGGKWKKGIFHNFRHYVPGWRKNLGRKMMIRNSPIFFSKNHPSHYDPGTGEETKIFLLYFPSFFFLAALFSVTNEAKLRLPLPPLALITCTVHQGFIKSKPIN